MKLAVVDTNIKSNVESTGAFKIKASAKAFKILSSGLYSDKILAVVRELSCNAYDSHVVAGKVNVPFEVHLPNKAEPWFSVEDFGIGLSKEDIDQVYTTYFESTKTDSNDVIGALGLGSKSPFSYTDSFTVTSIKDGIKLVYAMNLSSAGEPQPRLMLETETDEGNGVKVSVPVNAYDFSDFITAASKVYRTFELKPVILGVHDDVLKTVIKPQEYIIKTDSYGIRVADNGPRAINVCKAVQGQVAYSINDIYNYTPHRYLFDKMDLFFPIGQLDVTASRESISFDETTKENFHRKINEVTETIWSDVDKLITSQKSYFQACLKYQELSDTIPSALQKDVVYNGNVISDPRVYKFKNNELDGYSYSLLKTKNTRRKTCISGDKVTFSFQSAYQQIVIDKNVYFVNDIGGGKGRAVIRKYMQDKGINKAHVIAVADHFKLLPHELRQCFDVIRNAIDGIVLINASTLPGLPKKVITKTPATDLRYIHNTYHGYNKVSNNNTRIETYTGNSLTKKYYVKKEEYQSSLVRILIEDIELTDKVYILTKPQYNKIVVKGKDKNFIDVFDHFNEVLRDKDLIAKVQSDYESDKCFSILSDHGLERHRVIASPIMKKLGIVINASARPLISKKEKQYVSVANHWYIAEDIRNIYSEIRNTEVSIPNFDKYRELAKTFKKTPVLKHIPLGSIIGTDEEPQLMKLLDFMEITV